MEGSENTEENGITNNANWGEWPRMKDGNPLIAQITPISGSRMNTNAARIERMKDREPRITRIARNPFKNFRVAPIARYRRCAATDGQ
jgi:hypothetical protein